MKTKDDTIESDVDAFVDATFHKNNLTDEEWQMKREKVADQTKQLLWISQAAQKDGHSGNVQCICRKRVPLWLAYRCYFCGLILCEKCAKEHFGERPRHAEYFSEP